jgi:hypothetical protein
LDQSDDDNVEYKKRSWFELKIVSIKID